MVFDVTKMGRSLARENTVHPRTEVFSMAQKVTCVTVQCDWMRKSAFLIAFHKTAELRCEWTVSLRGEAGYLEVSFGSLRFGPRTAPAIQLRLYLSRLGPVSASYSISFDSRRPPASNINGRNLSRDIGAQSLSRALLHFGGKS